MGIFRLLFAGIGALLAVLGLAAVLFFEGSLPLVGLDVGVAGAKIMVAVGIALALAASIWGQALGAFGGSMATLGMVGILVALAPDVNISVRSGPGEDGLGPLGQRLNELYERALDGDAISLEDEPFEQIIMTERGGLSVFLVELDEAAQLRVSVEDDPAYPEADPYVSVFRPGERGHLDRVPMGSDDDGGDGLSSLLEVTLEPGQYLVEVKDISHSPDEGEASLLVKMSSVSEEQIREEFAARILRSFPEEGSMLPGGPLVQWSGTTTSDADQPLYAFSIDGSVASCFVVDAMPGVYGAPSGDSTLSLFSLDGSIDEQNDDWQEGQLGSRIMLTLDATEDGSPHEIFAEIRPFTTGEQLGFEARAAALERNGNCPPAESWEGERADY